MDAHRRPPVGRDRGDEDAEGEADQDGCSPHGGRRPALAVTDAADDGGQADTSRPHAGGEQERTADARQLQDGAVRLA